MKDTKAAAAGAEAVSGIMSDGNIEVAGGIGMTTTAEDITPTMEIITIHTMDTVRTITRPPIPTMVIPTTDGVIAT